MAERNNGTPARKRVNAPLIAGAVAVVLAAFVLVFAITAGTSTSPATVAGDIAPVAVQQAANEAQSQAQGSSTQVVAAGSAIAANAGQPVGEVIADDDVPLAAFPESNPLDGFTWLLLAGIAGATAFFLLSTRRANKDISRMRGSIR